MQYVDDCPALYFSLMVGNRSHILTSSEQVSVVGNGLEWRAVESVANERHYHDFVVRHS